MKHIFLYPKHDYNKLYFFLKDNGFSESLISSLRHNEGAIKINNNSANMRSPILANQLVEILVEDKESSSIPHNDIPLEILFEDEDLLVVNKQAGIPTIPSKSHFEDNLAGAVCKYMSTKQQHFIFRALGRLDKDTSGIVVIAKNQYAATMTQIEKKYEAICNNSFPENQKEFDICLPIKTIIEDGINKQKREIDENGKTAKTHVKIIKNYLNFAHISLSLSQGRTHQIRVHLSAVGHPLVGDSIYGNNTAQQPQANRTLLHCSEAKLTFLDGKSSIIVYAPIANDFSSFLNTAKHTNK